jgi:hypothetical protein
MNKDDKSAATSMKHVDKQLAERLAETLWNVSTYLSFILAKMGSPSSVNKVTNDSPWWETEKIFINKSAEKQVKHWRDGVVQRNYIAAQLLNCKTIAK